MAGPWEEYRSQPQPVGPVDPRVNASAASSRASAARSYASIQAEKERLALARQAAERAAEAQKLAATTAKEARTANALKRKKEMDQLGTRARQYVEDIYRVDRLLRELDKRGENVSGWMGETFKHVPGTVARGFAAELDPLKSSIARGGLTQMRQESPTGASVGNPSDRDIALFENSRGSLDQGQKQSDLRQSLMDVRNKTLMELSRIAPGVANRIRTKGTLFEQRRKKPGGSRVRVIGDAD